MKLFRNRNSWTSYRTILAEEFGILLTREPHETVRLICGHKVQVDEWLPTGPPAGTLVLVHGGGGNGRILAPLGEPMADAGWKVLAPDLPGYGLTEPAPGYRGEYSDWLDIIAAIAEAEPGPVVLAGFSMGGLTAFCAAQACTRVSGVIASTLLDLSDRDVFLRAARWPWLGRLSLFSMAVMPWLFDRLVMPLSLITPLAAISSSPRLQAYFQRDPLSGGSWKAARFFRMVHRHSVSNRNLTCPLLLVHPGKDVWTPTALSLAFYETINGPKRFRELTNGSHLPAERPAYQELVAEMKAFLDEVSPRA